MQWETISINANNEIYQLWHKDKKLLTYTVHPFSNTARVECEEEKRVFLIRKEGFRHNKTVLRNEYGIKIGEFGSENRKTFIDFGNERFYYAVNQVPRPELVIYKESEDRPSLVCGLNVTSEGNTSIHFSKSKVKSFPHPGLLMALCWYMFVPIAKELSTEFAV